MGRESCQSMTAAYFTQKIGFRFSCFAQDSARDENEGSYGGQGTARPTLDWTSSRTLVGRFVARQQGVPCSPTFPSTARTDPRLPSEESLAPRNTRH